MMFENLFSSRCKALVDDQGKALTGPEKDTAEAALAEAKRNGDKIWFDRDGYVIHKPNRLFASSTILQDDSGRELRICGYRVSKQADFCSCCGAPAPGGWWRCGGCGQLIGNDSKTCPHCGRVQNVSTRMDLKDGLWQRGEDIFAERFEYPEVASLIGNGINVQESERAMLLAGGRVMEVLPAGFHAAPDEKSAGPGDLSLVFVDCSDISLPIGVTGIRTSDDITTDIHMSVVLHFDGENADSFMRNLMGNSQILTEDRLSSALSYDEIARNVIADVDATCRDFCLLHTVNDLFCDAHIRFELERAIAAFMSQTLASYGLSFVRIKEVSFESEVFEELREKHGQIEAKRRENEFMLEADRLANEAARGEAQSEFDMDEYMLQLAQEKGIKDELRRQEMARVHKAWEYKQRIEELEHQQALDMMDEEHHRELEKAREEFDMLLTSKRHRQKLEQRLEEAHHEVQLAQLQADIEAIKLKTKMAQDTWNLDYWNKLLDLRHKKEANKLALKKEWYASLKDASLEERLQSEDDPEKRKDMIRAEELRLQSSMSPELLLAAAAARGDRSASETLATMTYDKVAMVEKAKAENREIYEKMLQMNERMFMQVTEAMKYRPEPPSNNTQIIK